MLTEYQEEWIELSQPDPIEKPIYHSTSRIVELRRKCFTLLFLIFIASMLIVAQNNQLMLTSYKLAEMKECAAELEKNNQTLLIDIAKLKSPNRIENIAIHRLGLVLPAAKFISAS